MMKAKPKKLILEGGLETYVDCPPEEATHLFLRLPGPSSLLVLPVQIRGRREGTGNWTWNGSTEAPGLKPSVLTRMTRLASILLALLAAACEPCAAQTLQLDRWKRAQVPAHRVRQVDAVVSRILANRKRYEAVARKTGVPWHVIAGLHNMEASGSFRLHLHEGSPLTGRTRWVPKGRPKHGKPPFTWETSATDALLYDRMERVNWKSLDAALYACERYNGTGYLRFHPGVPTPYLWSHTSIYNPPRGKYVADGKWSSTAVSSQTGIAAIWKRLEARKAITLPK